MYKVLLCWRYLRTRYIALASIISVTLGVATMIVVNSVMSGFTVEMQDRIHGILSDVVFESRSLEGFPDPDWHMQEIKRVAGEHIEAMTATVTVPAMLSFEFRGSTVTRPVQLVGIDEKTVGQVGDYAHYLQHPANREAMSFDLRDGGYDVLDHQSGPEARPREQLREAGWPVRRAQAEHARQVKFYEEMAIRQMVEEQAARVNVTLPASTDNEQQAVQQTVFTTSENPSSKNELSNEASEQAGLVSVVVMDPKGDAKPMFVEPIPEEPREPGVTPADLVEATTLEPHVAQQSEAADGAPPADPFADRPSTQESFDVGTKQHTGVVLGIALSSFRDHAGAERFLVVPGNDVKLSFPSAGTPPKIEGDFFTVVDLYESKMSEYDASLVFVPLRELQRLRGMIDPRTGVGLVSSIQIKLKNEKEINLVRDKLRGTFPPEVYGIFTWRDKQGPLLAAVDMEVAILNVLLFLIIAVAGFGILAIFFMIVVEKTRDIGILKSLGASGPGVMGIFLGYGLSLGIVGAGAGLVMGLLFVIYINEIADVLAFFTGHKVFDPSIYYFYRIPTLIDPLTVAWVVAGAIAIAVMASILPARRAARLHPVEALRYE
ncbi:MAG: ABC transporter permease [Pirellulales bacterium]|nr:ABC transporter permease [Pirellulales bacterium]